MKKIFKRISGLVLALTMVFAMSATAFAATPATSKFTKADGSALKMGMDDGMIASTDLTNGVATVTFKDYTLLWYTGSIANITGTAVESWNKSTATAKINMATAGSGGVAGVPVHIEFSFNMTPPGMSDSMDARFVCQ